MYELDYDQCIHLDAEALAEGGIKEAYDALLPQLGKYIERPAEIEEIIDNDLPSYRVRCRGAEYVIYSPESGDEWDSWGAATYTFFTIVNGQLASTEYRFYAINGGNDLSGMFLMPAQCEAAKQSIRAKTDWPYLPAMNSPWYGQYH